MFNNTKYIPAFWYSSNNFGDSVSHYLINKISGKIPVLVEKNTDVDKVMVTGSILNNSVVSAHVWGCGLAWSNDIVPQHKSIKAVRGLLTGEVCKRQNIVFDEVYGDPVLLLPRFYEPTITKKYRMGIIPHYIDSFELLTKIDIQKLYDNGIFIIDILSDTETFVNQILSCQKIISSTLHGIICAHAYGIPCEWVKFTNNIIGDDFKYKDYYSTTHRSQTSFIDLRETNTDNLIDISENMPIYNTEIAVDLNKLLANCPFKP